VVVIVGEVPVKLLPSVAVIVVAVPETVCEVKTMVAIPSALVTEVADANEPFPLDFVHVTDTPAVVTALLLTSDSCALTETVVPAAGLYVFAVTKYFVAVPTVKANESDVIAVREVGVNVNVKFPAVPLIRKSVNVATPFTAATVVVPDNVPPVPEAIVATTFTVELVTVFPLASTMRTTGCVAKFAPLTAPDGCVVIAEAVAVPNVKVNEDDVTADREVGVNVKVNGPAVPVSRKLVNVATPFIAATVVVPDSVPPVPVAIVATTLTVELVIVFPPESTIRITG